MLKNSLPERSDLAKPGSSIRVGNNCLHWITKQSLLPFFTSLSRVWAWMCAQVGCTSSVLRGSHETKGRSNLPTWATVWNAGCTELCKIPKWLKSVTSPWTLRHLCFCTLPPVCTHMLNLDMESPCTGAHILILPVWMMLLSQQAVHILPKGCLHLATFIPSQVNYGHAWSFFQWRSKWKNIEKKKIVK